MSLGDNVRAHIMKHKKTVLLALFTAMALVLSLVESALPPLAPIPGIKLGLANIITLILLQYFSSTETFYALLARILLSCLFAGQAMTLIYSLSGGILCFLCMWGVKKLLRGHFTYLTGMTGGCTHNIGQILAAWLVTGTPHVLFYLPILLISGLLTGLFTGLCAHFTKRHLSSFFYRNNN